MMAAADLGLRRIGSDVQIDRDARFFRPENITIGDHVRIDAQVVISASHPVTIGDYVHLAVGAKIFASGGSVRLESLCTLSGDVKLYTASDDYTGGSLTNPTVPASFKELTHGPIVVGRHVIVGAGSVVLPGVTLAEGAAVGALSLVKSDVPEGAVVAGIPARQIATRDVARLRELERELRAERGESSER
jgi:dTDP-4-amino-4,6-dideoxy-D-glucose acyltransferase